MTRTLPSRDTLDRAADRAVETMRDRCVLLVRSITTQGESWADGAETVCGFAVKIRREDVDSTQVVSTVTMLRLPMAVPDVETLARVRLTHYRGQALAVPELYDVTAAARGTIQWNLDLRRQALDLRFVVPVAFRRGATTLAAQHVALVALKGASERRSEGGRASHADVEVWGLPTLDVAVGDRFTWNGAVCEIVFVRQERVAATVAEAVVLQ